MKIKTFYWFIDFDSNSIICLFINIFYTFIHSFIYFKLCTIWSSILDFEGYYLLVHYYLYYKFLSQTLLAPLINNDLHFLNETFIWCCSVQSFVWRGAIYIILLYYYIMYLFLPYVLISTICTYFYHMYYKNKERILCVPPNRPQPQPLCLVIYRFSQWSYVTLDYSTLTLFRLEIVQTILNSKVFDTVFIKRTVSPPARLLCIDMS